MSDMPTFSQRTDWAEYFVEQLMAQPLISECVYRSPQHTDKTQKEVVDLLLALGGRAFLLSLKCQQEPGRRSPTEEETWAAEAAAIAAKQIKGALGTLSKRAIWCEHPRRGRTEFAVQEFRPVHGLVLVEALSPLTLPSTLPLHVNTIPISYFSINDFCNVVGELRTIPELEAYLDARRSLPLDAIRMIGNEKALYGYYLLNDETFVGCLGPGDARLFSSALEGELNCALERKAEADKYAWVIERVADCLAERHPRYMNDLGEAYQSHFDPSAARKGYLRMQQELCGLRLPGRSQLGRQLAGLIDKADAAPQPVMTYSSVRCDEKPDFVFVLASGRGEQRGELIAKAHNLLLGAMAYYDKRRGMVIVDRDSVSFEVLMLEVPRHSVAAFHFGEGAFGRLRTDDIPGTLVPRTSVRRS